MISAGQPNTPSRCPWVGEDPLYREYHDKEWGVPERENRALFEMLCLEGAQAGNVADWLWETVGGQPRVNRFHTPAEVPASTPASDQLSRRLKQAGFKFVGTTICYAFMQATGMVNDHLLGCFRHPQNLDSPRLY